MLKITTLNSVYEIREDDLRAMLCSIQQIVDSADNLAACPSKIADWSVLRAKIKNARRKVSLMWSLLR